jgi:hypothetical protein
VNYYGVTHFEAYIDFISLVFICAPDRFPREEFLKDEDQYDLDKVFQVLRDQFVLVEERIEDAEKLLEIRTLIEKAYAAYRAADAVKGAHILQDARGVIRKSARRG